MAEDVTMPLETPSLGTPVAVNAIAKELKKLWAADQTRTRATLFNFAIICEGEKAMQENTDLLANFVGSHAFLALLIGVDPKPGESNVQAWINAHCYLPKAGAKHVCSEQVSYFIQGPVRALLPNLLFSQLDYDLPLTLWWRGSDLRIVDSEVWRWVDRLIFDSECASNPHAQCAELHEQIDSQRTVLCDLAWTRSLYLRQALAQMFDLGEHVRALSEVERLVITHAPGASTTAKLLVGWFAAQLGWKAPAGKGLRFVTPNGEVTVELRELEGAPLSHVQLKCKTLTVTAKHAVSADFLHVEVREANGNATQHLMPADATDIAGLIDEELASWGRHRVYLKALEAAEQLF
jgi:glucose-6-phosphate dehydrogenase assembly protein OpcA